MIERPADLASQVFGIAGLTGDRCSDARRSGIDPRFDAITGSPQANASTMSEEPFIRDGRNYEHARIPHRAS